MIFIFVSFLLVALLTMLCSKCCRRADHKFFQHCCGELIITAALALAGLVIVGASMNGVQVKYVDAVFKERFNDYAEEFSIPLETHTEELAGRRKAMTALFVVLVPCVVALAAVVLGYYLRVFDDAHHAFAFLSLGAVLPTLIAVCGLTVCFSLGLIVYRAPSLYAPIFRNSIPTILTVSLITLGFLLIFLLMMCCWNRCGRDFVIEWKRFAVVLVLASLAALVAVVFQLSTAYRKSNSAVPKACEDWSMLNKVCNYTGSAEHRHSPRPVILLSDLSINPSTSSTNTNRALPTPSIPIPIPSINSTTPSIPIPSINSTHSTLTSPDGSSPYPPHPYPVGNPVAYTRECTELGENLYHYKYVSEKYYVNPPRTDDPLCFDLAPLAADTHDQAVRGAEAIRKASAWLSAFGVFVFAGILLVAWCSGLCYYMKRREGAVIN